MFRDTVDVGHDLGLRLHPTSFPKSFMSFAVLFNLLKDISAREMCIVSRVGAARGRRVGGRGHRCFGRLGFTGREDLHHFIDLLGLDPFRAPVFEDLRGICR